MRNFRQLDVWQRAIDVSVEITFVTQAFPKEERYGIVSQLRRAGVSISSNIAEGCSRTSELDFKRFLEIAAGSAFEAESQLIISEKCRFISSGHAETLISNLQIIQKQLSALIIKIKHDLKRS